MNIGILTFHRAVNYGAFLQSYSLCKALNRESDIKAEVIDYSMQSAWNYYDVGAWNLKKKIGSIMELAYLKKQNAVFAESVNRNKGVFSNDLLVSDNMEEFRSFVKSRYDAIVVGSDEVWKICSWRRFPNPYFLIGDYGCRKISYAASFGKTINLTANDEKKMRDYLADFEVLSVRDRFAYDYLNRNKIGNHVMLSCDPSFLYDFKEELNNCSNPLRDGSIKIDKNKKTVIVMVDDKSAETIRKQLKGEYNLVSLYRKHKGYINVTDVDPFCWLKIISEADFVLTCFYHCMCFSICNNTPFIAIGVKGKQHKLEDLLLNSELEKNYMSGEQLEKANLPAEIKKRSGDTDGFARFVSDKRSGFEEYLKLLRTDSSQNS